MIAEFEDEAAPAYTDVPYRIYAMDMRAQARAGDALAHGASRTGRCSRPSVGRYAQGMIVEVPLQLQALPAAPKLKDLHAALAQAYENEPFIEVASLEEAASLKTLDPEGLNGTNKMRLFVFGSDDARQARLVALLDNLGKGAAGAAVQNLNLALGLPEDAGL